VEKVKHLNILPLSVLDSATFGGTDYQVLKRYCSPWWNVLLICLQEARFYVARSGREEKVSEIC